MTSAAPLSGPEPDVPAAPPLAGRERERAALGERLGAALAGRGGLVLIGGEAGIGKTALAEAACREAAARGALVLVGRCYDLTETPPYGPWTELFDGCPPLRELSPLLGGALPPGAAGAGEGQAALFRRVRDALAGVAARRPLVLLLDDLHWADGASLDLLRFLARGAPAAPLLLIATYRADELTRRDPLYAMLPLLVREAGAARLDLRRLDDGAVRELVRAAHALPPPDEARLVAWTQERAEGNPFYVGELLRALAEEGHLRPRGGGWALGDLARVRLPPLLRQVIDRRLARLGEEARELLAAAATIGPEAPLALWAAVAAVEEEALLGPVERAVEARVLEAPAEGTGVRFVHALIRATLYEGVLPLRRRVWHRRAAEAIAAALGPDPDAVAQHFRAAGDPRAREWLVRAGERAQRAYAWLAAAARFEAALALPPGRGAEGAAGAGERGWLLVRLARMRRYDDAAGAIGALDEAVRLAAALGDPVLAAYARFFLGLQRCFEGDYRRGVADLEVGAAALDALAPADRARVAAVDPELETSATGRGHWGTLAVYLATVGRHADAARAGARALAGGDAEGETADAHYALALVHAALGRPAEAEAAFACARAAYRAAGNPYQVATTASEALAAVAIPYRADRLAERRALAAEAEGALARAAGVREELAPRLASLPLLVLEGAWDEARALADPAAPGGADSFVDPIVPGALARWRGEEDVARRLVAERLPAGAATAPGEVDFAGALALQRLAAALTLDAGDLAGGRAWLAAHDRWLAWGGATLGVAEGRLGWAAYERAAGDPARARRQATEAMDAAESPRQPLALLAARRLLGELDTAAGRPADAAAHLADALALADACAAPSERALTLLALAELRAAEGRRADAEASLAEARALCVALGAAPAVARADALAARLAAAPSAVPAAPPGAIRRG